MLQWRNAFLLRRVHTGGATCGNTVLGHIHDIEKVVSEVFDYGPSKWKTVRSQLQKYQRRTFISCWRLTISVVSCPVFHSPVCSGNNPLGWFGSNFHR